MALASSGHEAPPINFAFFVLFVANHVRLSGCRSLRYGILYLGKPTMSPLRYSNADLLEL
jgi:hypothetical protein